MTTPDTGPRKLVKARLLPDILAEVEAYAARNRRSVSASIEDLVVLGLRGVEREARLAGYRPPEDRPGPDTVHTR